MMNCNIVTLLSFLIFTLPMEQSVARQNKQVFLPVADSLFQSVEMLYQTGQLQAARETLGVLQSLPRNQRSSAALYLHTRFALDREDYDETADLLEQFAQDYPDSRYVPYMELIEAELLYARELYVFSLEKLLGLITHVDDAEIENRAARKFLEIFDNEIPEVLYDNFIALYNNNVTKELSLLKKAQLHYYAGSYDEVINELEQISLGDVFLPIGEAASNLRSLMNDVMNAERFIAVLFPFNGEYAERGRKLYNGAQVALKKKQDVVPHSISIKAIDTRASIREFPELLQKIADDKSIIAVIGPVVQELRLLASTLAPFYELPIIIPGNNESGNGIGNDYVYQIKGSKSSEGAALARYAVENLNLSTFAIMSPIGGSEEGLVESFAIEVEKLGGEILAHEWYFPGNLDFNAQISKIRKIGYDFMMTDSLSTYISESIVDSTTIVEDSLSLNDIDSLTTLYIDSLSISTLDSIWNLYLDTLATRRREAGIRYFDTLDYPVTTFDAIFIPVESKDDIEFIVNQYAFYNFDTILLGNSHWYDPVILVRLGNNVGTVYITSDYFIDDYYTPWITFRDNYRNDIGSSPGVDELYGYESTLFLLAAVQNLPTRQRLIDELEQLNILPESVRGYFEIDESHQKSNWHVIRYRRGQFLLQNRQ